MAIVGDVLAARWPTVFNATQAHEWHVVTTLKASGAVLVYTPHERVEDDAVRQHVLDGAV